MHNIRFSVRMPAYNSIHSIEKAINSVRTQSFANWQLIIVDDGSSDATFELAKKFAVKDRRISVIRQNNKGVSSARNTALNACMGEYVLFIDSDDCFLSGAFESFNNTIIRNPVDIVVSHYCIFNKDLKKYVTFQDCKLDKFKFETPQQVVKQMREKNMTPAMFRFAVRRSLIIDNGINFDTSLSVGEDTLFIAKMVCCAKTFAYLPKVIYQYNINSNSRSRKRNAKWAYSLLLSCQKLYSQGLNQPEENKKFLNNYICIQLNFLLQSYPEFTKDVKTSIKKWIKDNKEIMQNALAQQPVLMGLCKTLGIFNGMLMGAKLVKAKVKVTSR